MGNPGIIGFGGGCHWCTEAVFQSLKGVSKVEQGWIASEDADGRELDLSEAVIVHYDPGIIPLKDLIHIHLLTHSATNDHAMREKYRSAVYYFDDKDKPVVKQIISDLQPDFDNKIITKTLPFKEFEPSPERIQNYYRKNPDKPFCKTYIEPKLKMLRKKYELQY